MITLSFAAVAAVFSCGVLVALTDFVRKKASNVCAPALLTAWLFTAVTPLYMVWALTVQDWRWESLWLAPGTASILCNVLANIFFIRSVAVSPLSRVVPILSLTPMMAALTGYVFLGEHLMAAQWTGIVLSVAGLVAIYIPAGQSLSPVAIARDFIKEKGAGPMLLTAVLWTLTAVFDRVALRHAAVSFNGLIHFGSAATLLWVWLLVKSRGRIPDALPPRGSWPLVGLLAVLYAGAMGLQMVALTMVYVGVVEVVKRVMGQLSSVVLGRLYFGESVTLTKIMGLILMGAGVYLIVLGG